MTKSLNPFSFRASAEPKETAGPIIKLRLNPFSFRASAEHHLISAIDLKNCGLNPFSFRASAELTPQPRTTSSSIGPLLRCRPACGWN